MSRPPDLEAILQASARDHSHLCPRQILGARMGLAGLWCLEVPWPLHGKRVLIVAETDGCFLDGLSAATGCTPGHRTLRIEDYGKTAGTFVDTETERAVRIAPALDIRAKAPFHAPKGLPRYQAQLLAYRVMPEEEMFSFQPVVLKASVAAILSKPRIRVACSACGEEILNEREVRQGQRNLCRHCAHGGYFIRG